MGISTRHLYKSEVTSGRFSIPEGYKAAESSNCLVCSVKGSIVKKRLNEVFVTYCCRNCVCKWNQIEKLSTNRVPAVFNKQCD